MGLPYEYKDKNSEIGNWLGWIFVLSLLDPEEISECFVFDFCSIMPNNDKLIKFSDYMVDTYVGENALFPPEIWAAKVASSERLQTHASPFTQYLTQIFTPAT